jgi:Tfp pilus assembly protein PilN
LSSLETNYARIKNETTEVFQSTLPQEKNIVSPLVQLEQKLQSFREDYQLFASFRPDSLSSLEVLHSLTIHRPSQTNMKVDDLLIAADTVRISGTCNSFESVYQWQRLLREVPVFTTVEVQDVQRQPQGTVGFTLLLSSAETEQK